MTITIRKNCPGEKVMAHNLLLLYGSFILGGIYYFIKGYCTTKGVDNGGGGGGLGGIKHPHPHPTTPPPPPRFLHLNMYDFEVRT